MGHHRLAVGVIGAGMIAQIMHLPNLAELDDLFEIRALCDSSGTVLSRCAKRFGIARTCTDWQDLLREDLDAVFVLTSGSHAPMAVAAAAAGRHVFVEKPMCYSVAEGTEMIEASDRAGVTLMVGYPKRYDPAYRRVAAEVGQLADLRFARLTTMESPSAPYIAHHSLSRPDDIDSKLAGMWRADSAQRVRAAIGERDSLVLRTYEAVLLDTMVHEFNLLRGLLGEPTAVKFASLRQSTVTVVLDFGSVECVLAWLDLPGIARYEMELCLYDPARRVRLAFGSPYLRNAPSLVDIESGDMSGPATAVAREIVSYEEPFQLELIEFHRAVTERAQPLTSGLDGLQDIALCQSVIGCATSGTPMPAPTSVAVND